MLRKSIAVVVQVFWLWICSRQRVFAPGLLGMMVVLWLGVSCSQNQFQQQPTSCSKNVDCPGSQVCDQGKCKTPVVPECKFGEIRECYTGPANTKFVGICKPGTQTCTPNDKWGACTGETVPAAKEICDNNQDDDCDGKSDKDDPDCIGCTAGQTQECYTGDAKTKNVGSCRAGKQTCKNDKTWGPCEGEILPKPAEVCGNLVDDDCNGKTDLEETACGDCKAGETRECYEGPANTKNVGSCKAGKQTCSNQQKWGPCENQIKPAAFDACSNKQDDDCNGTVDDGACLNKCKQDSECQSSEFCYTLPGKDEGVCIKPCRSKSTCKPGQDCIPMQPGLALYCLPIGLNNTCFAEEFVGCESGMYCDRTTKMCNSPKVVSESELCDGYERICDSRSACIFMPNRGICRRSCKAAADCGAGQVCSTFTDTLGRSNSVCLASCSGTTSTCPAGEECITYQAPDVHYCSPKGTLSVWDVCFLGGENCKDGLRCYVHPDIREKRPIGYCLPNNCSGTTPCPRIPNTAGTPVCTKDIQKSYNNCIVPCSSNPTLCQNLTNFSCRQIGVTPAYCTP